MGSYKVLSLVIIVLLLFGFTADSRAQVEDLVERYAGENADGFLRPLITAFGSNLNSGLYRSAHVPKMGIHFNVAINGMVAIIPNSQRTFEATTTGYFVPVQTVEAPTVMGDPDGVVVTSPSGTAYAFPGGFDSKTFLLGMPTITVGSVFGTEASLRFFKATLNDDIGDVSLFGIGGRHSISQYIPMSPVDIAAGVFYHQFKIGEIVDSDLLAIHAEVGKSFTILGVYGGLAYETTKATADYTFDSGSVNEDVNVDITGDNKFRLTLGVGLSLGLFHWNVDYNIGNQQVINTGISIGI